MPQRGLPPSFIPADQIEQQDFSDLPESFVPADKIGEIKPVGHPAPSMYSALDQLYTPPYSNIPPYDNAPRPAPLPSGGMQLPAPPNPQDLMEGGHWEQRGLNTM